MSTQVKKKSGLIGTVSQEKWNKPADSSIKAELRNGRRTCQCSMCGRFFGSPYPFDKHLIDESDKCRDDAAMLKIGLWQNEHGVWLSTSKPSK